ncbi:conjugal transfer protein TraN [Acidovorax sp. sic0104]|nr:conjugal transfer protein TraN [Acidovorax sp. sic0104]
MLGWAAWVMPAMWSMAYAQALPNQEPTTAQIEAATSRGKEFGTDDQATSDTLINKRAAKILSGSYQGTGQLRTPNLTEDATPVRAPKVVADPNEQANAERQAARVKPRTQQEMVSGAQSGSGIGVSVYGQMDAGNKTLVTNQVEPGVTQTTTNRVNLNEVVSGFSSSEVNRLNQMGGEIYANPEKAKSLAEQNKRNLRRDGCRRTQFMPVTIQNIDRAPASADHRILKVEFFDLVKEPIPGTNPVEYQIITKPSTYKRGQVKMGVATLGASATTWWDKVDETFAIRYTYTPYSNPKNRNFFTYNHSWAMSNGAGGFQRIHNQGLVSYGSPSDGWTPVLGYTLPYGASALYMSADLYQTEVNYHEVPDGVPCPEDPPQSCEVPATDGTMIRWCPGSFGSNIALMYDDQANPNDRRYGKSINDTLAVNASRKDYASDTGVTSGVIRGLNATSSEKAKELIGSCRRDAISRIEVNQGKPYGIPDINTCSETLINPYPQGCKNIQRSFGLAYVGEHNFATVRAFMKIKVPIIDPQTGKQIQDTDGNPLFTYRKDPANVAGPIRTDFTIMGGATCPGGNCSTEIPDDPKGGSEGYYVEYTHTPMGGDPKTYAFDRVYVQDGGSGTFTHYGEPSANWLPSGSASGNGSLHQVRLMAKAYNVPINTFAGCEKYMQFVADGFCKGGKLTCVATSATRTVGGVTFGPGLPNSGIVSLLKKWGTDSTAVFPDYEGGNSADPTPTGAGLTMLDDKMCWEAQGESFTSCATMDDGGRLKRFFKGQEEWGTDCNIATDPKGTPLESSGMCKRVPALDSCDTRFEGLYTGQCYNPTLAYDCGETKQSNLPVVVEELGDSCSGAMRCLGTECHRPNLAGSHGGEFAQAASGMEALNFMISEMVCAETGAAPTSVDQACTPIVFGGKPMYCKIPIGNQIGLTPNCCKEAKDGAGGAPSWIDYLKATYALYKITRNETFQSFMSNYDAYNQSAEYLGEIAKPVENMLESASGFITDKVVTPFRAGFDNLFGRFGSGGAVGSTPAAVAVDAPVKAASISGIVDAFKQTLMKSASEVLKQIGGEMGGKELSAMFFTENVMADGTTRYAQSALLENIAMAFQIYSILRLIGHIIFACKQEEYEWGMNEKWKLCTFVDSCCAKKVPILGCVEKRQLYCCYKSIVARIMSEQIIKKNLAGNRPRGYRSGPGGESLGQCNINCGGFTPFELAAVDWSQVDLTEWTDTLVESGLLNTADPRTNFGVSKNKIEATMTVGRAKDEEGVFDQRAGAIKTAEGWIQNTNKITDFAEAVREDGVEHCYVDNKKMPFTYPGCIKK